MHWLYLALAICSEVAGTTALNAAGGFRNFWPSVAVVIGYGSAFYFLSLTLDAIPMGVAYAIWSGVGIALITIAGWVFYQQRLGVAELAGMGLIVAGVVVLKIFSEGN